MALNKPIKMTATPSLKKVKKRWQRKGATMSRLEKAHARIATFLGQWVDHNFKSEGGSVGGWADFRLGGRRLPGGGFDPSAKLLQDTGRLRASFEPFSSKRDAGIGSDLDYAPVHEEGLGHIPQRRMLPVKRDVVKDVRDIFRSHVRKSLRA